MTKRNKKAKRVDPFAKYKLASIPFLLCLLGWVLMSGSKEETSADGPKSESPVSSPIKELASSDSFVDPTRVPTKSGTPTKSGNVAWPAVDLTFLDGPNPFASFRHQRPALKEVATLAGVSAESRTQANDSAQIPLERIQEELGNLPLRYRFKSPQRDVVMLGDQLFELGDSVSQDLTVHEIEKAHLILKRTQPAESIQ